MNQPPRQREIDAALERRAAAVADTSVKGRTYCHQLSVATDQWIAALADQARDEHPKAPRFALVAVGGYGRGELSPHSDIDLLFLHESKPKKIEAVASAIWYPIWDAGLKLGHAVRTFDEHVALTKDDLDTATAVLTARPIAGDLAMGDRIARAGREGWSKRQRRWLAELQQRVRVRQAEAGEVAYILEPDLKDGHGGIRDAQSMWWAECGGLTLSAEDNEMLNECYDVLLDARVALHKSSDRAGDVLRLENQDDAASAAGAESADAFMTNIAAAARTVAWLADESWGRVGRATGGRAKEVEPGVVLLDDEIELSADVDLEGDPTYVLSVAIAAARNGARIGRGSLDRLANLTPQWPGVWPVGAIDKLVALLLEGHRAVRVIEALDQRGLVTRMLPEWEAVRSRPQRNAYHRYTVDRHLWETAANAAELSGTVARPDLLVLGALFHDIGKGYPGDHTEVGMEMVSEMGPRLGLTQADTQTLVSMVEHHLLLPDVAVRRDLSDPATIQAVADEVGDLELLELLHGLTIADSKATGPAAWGGWKEGLVEELVERVAHVVGGGEPDEAISAPFPDAATLASMATDEPSVVVDADRVVVVYSDTHGAFSRIAGVLSLYGLDVLSARAHTDEPQLSHTAMAASEFKISSPADFDEWESFKLDLVRAMKGQLAIEPRLAERAHTYRRRQATQAAEPVASRVEFQDEVSSNATVLEVRCPSKIGVLYRITDALASVGLSIRHATVQTVGLDVVDTFYVRDWEDRLVTDEFHRREIERAVLHAVS